ncbi:hypothetical protein MTR67_013293 [Solanum verrucosum]|uniref:CCHC-type domain-containing protein n=1 Tax=Solanum verrucosum TaxID=315347 RepID=A0AAF0QC78_SOLVR|nr:hypothetical protein MTR67_013293 [Solanum verrucosum]
MSTVVKILRTSELDLRIHTVVRHKGGNKTPACAKCGRSHSWVCRDGSTSCFKKGHFTRECPKSRQSNGNEDNRAQSSSVSPPDRAASK